MVVVVVAVVLTVILINVASLSITHYGMHQIMGGHVPVDVDPPALCQCTRPSVVVVVVVVVVFVAVSRTADAYVHTDQRSK